jgi:hypothetical protein
MHDTKKLIRNVGQLFLDPPLGYELDDVLGIVKESVEEVIDKHNSNMWWLQVRTALKQILETCSDSELDSILLIDYGEYPNRIGGSRSFFERLYKVIDDTLEERTD